MASKLLEKKGRNKPSVCVSVSQPEVLYITKPIPSTTASKENSNVKVLKVEEFYGQPPTIHGGRLKTTTIISADSIRRNRQQAKISQIADMAEIPFELPDDDKENSWKAQSDTMSVTDSVLEHCTIERPTTPAIKITDATFPSLHNSTANNSEQQPRHISLSPYGRAAASPAASPAKSLEHQFASILIADKQRYPTLSLAEITLKQNLVALTMELNNMTPISPSRSYRSGNASPLLSSGMPSPHAKHISTSTERDVYQRPSPSPSKMKFLQTDQPVRARSRSVSPTLLSQYQSSQCVSSTGSLSSNSDYYCIKSSHGDLSWAGTKLRKIAKKTFTIKNVAHCKISMKLDIVGPGFQVSVFLFI